MKKKLENLAMEIACDSLNPDGNPEKRDPVCYKTENGYLVYDRFRILKTADPVPGCRLETEENKTIKYMSNLMKELYSLEKDYRMREIPSAKEIRQEIRQICGRKRDRVVMRYRADMPALNAKEVIKGLEALNAENLYIAWNNYRINPVFIVSDDDTEAAENVMLILPVIASEEKIGMWTV